MCDCRIQVRPKSEISAGVNFMLVRTKAHVGSLPSFLLGQAPSTTHDLSLAMPLLSSYLCHKTAPRESSSGQPCTRSARRL